MNHGNRLNIEAYDNFLNNVNLNGFPLVSTAGRKCIKISSVTIIKTTFICT